MAVTEVGHHSSRFFGDQDGCLHLNGSTLYIDGTTGNNNIVVADNLANAFEIKEGSNSYVKIVTTNSSESVTIGQNLTMADAKNIVVNTTTGTKIGTATGQKLGFWNATPVVQQVLATGGGATVDNVITLLQTLGLCKQS